MMKETIKKRILAARGELAFEQLFIHAKLIEVYSGRIIEDASVGVIDGVIASVCPDFPARAETIIDCEGMYMSPSFIDAHMHIESSRLLPYAYCEGAVPHGTGCIMTDPMQIVNAAGEEGLRVFCELLKDAPIRSFIQFPSRVPAAEGLEHSGAFFTPEDTIRLLRKSGALTLGEVNAMDLDRESTLEKLVDAWEKNIHVNGHCPGMDHSGLCAAASAGIRDDHESETYEELLERLSLGIAVMVRQGTIEQDCRPLISGVVKNHLPTDSLMFCTDDKSAQDIVKNGCIDYAVRIAVSCGLSPVKAIQMATVNAAKHFGLDRNTGSIAPGRYADFLLFPSLEELKIKKVFFGGKLAAMDGKLLTENNAGKKEIYSSLLHTIRIPELDRKKLSVSVAPGAERVQAVVIKILPGSLLTKKQTAEIRVKDGMLLPDLKRDILPVAVIDRYSGRSHTGTAMICGLGIKRGAVASSTAQEGNNIVVSGTNYPDMLAAVQAVADAGGGNAICIGGKITAFLPLPVAGILGSGSIGEEIAARNSFSEALKETGSENPFLLSALTVSLCPSIPEIGLTDMGLVQNGRKVNSILEG